MSENSDFGSFPADSTTEGLTEDAASVVATNPSTDGAPDIEMLDNEVARVRDKSKPHAFIVMPFGKKKDRDGTLINFDSIYQNLIKPAIIEAGFEPTRADEEYASGDILTDMFQELLLADLVVADMSIDNANVFYEIGVRHALRRRGVVHIQAGRTHMPFDVFNVRTIQYQSIDSGEENYSETLKKDKVNLSRAIINTWKSDLDAIHSPVFNLLNGLQEPDRTQLATPLATGFWREQTEWEERIDIAQREKSVGDILLLTEEINNPLIKEDALLRSGMALDELGRKKLAIKEFRKGLVMNPRNRLLKTEIARLQSQLGRVDAAIVRLERLLAEKPEDTRAIRTLGRIYSDLWRERWKEVEPSERRHNAFSAYHWLIKSINTYMNGFYSNLNEFEPGLKALILTEVLTNLAEELDDDSCDPAISELCEKRTTLSSAVHVALDAAMHRDPNEYWVHAGLALWHLLNNESETFAIRSYQNAVSHARGNLSYLQTALRPLDTLLALDIRVDRAAKAKAVVDNEINLIGKHTISKDDTRSVIFSGQPMYEASAGNRYTLNKEQKLELTRRIENELDNHQPTPFYGRSSHAYINGISGLGAMTFVECCLRRSITVHIFFPCEESEYICKNLAGSADIDRYYSIKSNENVHIRFQHERLGPIDKDNNLYERNIRWTVLSALQASGKGLHLIALTGDKGQDNSPREITNNNSMIGQCRDLGGSYTLIDMNDLKLLSLDNQDNTNIEDGSLPIAERVEILRQCIVLKSLHEIDLQVIAAHCKEREFNRDEVILTQDQTGQETHFIVEGELVIFDTEIEIDRRQKGDVVGEMSLLGRQLRTATVKAARQSSTLELSDTCFELLLQQRPQIKECLRELYYVRTRQTRELRNKHAVRAEDPESPSIQKSIEVSDLL